MSVCRSLTAHFSKPKQDGVHSIAVLAKRAFRVQQLLKNLIVGRKFDVDLNAEMVAPEFQGILQRLCGKVGGDEEVRCRIFSRQRQRCLEMCKGDPREFQIRFCPTGRRSERCRENPFRHRLAVAAAWRGPTRYREN